MVCQLSTRGYNRLFLDLVRELAAEGGTPVQRVRTLLLSSDAESSRWPSDSEFRQAWLDYPLYRVLVQRRVRMLLEAVETLRLDPVDPDNGDAFAQELLSESPSKLYLTG